ncbi:ABC transporter substrate-binding protein [Bosea sp. 685]|uniref:ABC transporter substrate-binding protein n=1 Tax=Bosea sp. 685 TaxID=3080057 RepID=UPI002892BF41|nr:ABC transporter substrate-binding protein [Bosea sp. 685]WNJ88557.1 ABC transporter substrate-binding protein [Bosea sp. 685]
MTRSQPSRRQALAGGLALTLALPGTARAALPRRIATVDWSVLETLLALGVAPVAATELRQFAEIAVEPIVPAATADLGLRGTVNFEMLRLVEPELIYSSSFYAASEPQLRTIAPVETFSIYTRGGEPFAACEAMTRRIGARLGITERAELYLAETQAEFAALRAGLPRTHLAGDGRPVIPINLGDARHFRVFGADSMFGEALARLGIANAWTQATSYSAMAPVGLEALARVPEAWIALIPPVPPEAMPVLARSAFWNALPNIRAGRLLILPSINPYGALPAARRFARQLAQALNAAARR